MRLTVENKGAGVVDIYMDEEGRKLLIDSLQRLQRTGSRADHDHLMTPAWSGTELSEEKHNQDSELVHQLNIILLPDR